MRAASRSIRASRRRRSASCRPPPRSGSTLPFRKECRASVTSGSHTRMPIAPGSTIIWPARPTRPGRAATTRRSRHSPRKSSRRSQRRHFIIPTSPSGFRPTISAPWRARSVTCTRPRSYGRTPAAAYACAARNSLQSRLAASRGSKPMANETVELAAYASGLRYEQLPTPVVERAKQCIADTVATIMFGVDLPWSRIIVDYAKRNGAGGRSYILGAGQVPIHAPSAALANGALAHAFELDNLTQPNSGSHPGATAFTAALAVAQERGIGGRELIAATVAGFEVMIRIGV